MFIFVQFEIVIVSIIIVAAISSRTKIYNGHKAIKLTLDLRTILQINLPNVDIFPCFDLKEEKKLMRIYWV